MTLFTDLSVWTMLHGIVLGGGAMGALFGTLLLVYVRTAGNGSPSTPAPIVRFLSVASAALTWITVLAGTYFVFPPYRAAPSEGATDLSPFPRSMLLSDPSTAWLHSFGMELKEHVPWIAVMLATAVAFVVVRHGDQLMRSASVRRTVLGWLAVSLVLVSSVALLGVFVNKVAPVQ